jgi:hypothetical protein
LLLNLISASSRPPSSGSIPIAIRLHPLILLLITTIKARGKIHEVPLENFNKDDSNDSDFEEAPLRPRSSKKSRHRKSKKSKSRPSHKPSGRRERYASDSDDVVSETDDEASDDFSEASESDEPVKLNQSGRPTRRITEVKGVNYEESDVSDEK